MERHIARQLDSRPALRWSYSFSRNFLRLHLADIIFLVLIGLIRLFPCIVIGGFYASQISTALHQNANNCIAVLALAFPFIGSFGKDAICL